MRKKRLALAAIFLLFGLISSFFTWMMYSRYFHWKDALLLTSAVSSRTQASYNGGDEHYVIRIHMFEYADLPGVKHDYGGNPYTEVEVDPTQFEQYRDGYAIDFAYRTEAPYDAILRENLDPAIPKELALGLSIILLSAAGFLFYSGAKVKS